MDYFLTESQTEIRDLARRIANEKVKPVVAKHDRESSFPWDIVEEFRNAGLFSVYIPEEFGGLGGGIMELVIVTEELSRICGGISLAVAGTALGTFPILLSGNDDQRARFLPDLVAGKSLAAFCLTEPAAGSDAGNIQTKAVRKGDKYILNGTKHFITNASVAKVYTVVASTNPDRGTRGASAFIVEDGTPGLRFGKVEDKMGIRASKTCEVIFEDCEVPVENRLGREGEGFKVAMRTLDRSRPGVAAQAVGIAQGAFDLAAEYASKREQFGKSIGSFQGVQFMLADMATQVEAARALVYATARMIDSGAKKIAKESAMCKVYAGDTAMKVSTDAVQIFGGYGYMRDYPIEKFMRDAKITQIYEGTNQIQRTVIGRHILKETASKIK
ncbi:MAG: acyl-CoA dehydrogenase [Calditrichaeota bacterium]|nr:acyl-CoA dehydrogenase [Calditrichota bacterium]MBT7617083.1 acyl-CoA dehydrogenase [Calditrichota bacterium]MBT7790109.1 acyl-CoA dehydrogenase [Calditrichota bacterium]